MTTITLFSRGSRLGKFLYFIIRALGFGNKPKYEVPKKGYKAPDTFGPLDVNRVRVDAPQELIDALKLSEEQIKHGSRRAAIMKLGASPVLMKETSLHIGFYSNPVVKASNEWKLEDQDAELLAAHGYVSTILTAVWAALLDVHDCYYSYTDAAWVDLDGQALSEARLAELVNHLLIWQNTAHTDAGVGKEVADMYQVITEALYPH